MILRRLFRRGPDRKLTERLIEMLAQRSVASRAAEDYLAIVRSITMPPGTRAKAVLEIVDAPPLTHLLATEVEGLTAGHGGRMKVIGVHLLVRRDAAGAGVGAGWPADWRLPVRAQRLDPPGGVGPPREFRWQASDASDPGTVAAAERLAGNERIQRRVIGVLREPSTMLFEIAPLEGALRVAAHQTARTEPDPTVVEAVVTVGRALTE